MYHEQIKERIRKLGLQYGWKFGQFIDHPKYAKMLDWLKEEYKERESRTLCIGGPEGVKPIVFEPHVVEYYKEYANFIEEAPSIIMRLIELLEQKGLLK